MKRVIDIITGQRSRDVQESLVYQLGNYASMEDYGPPRKSSPWSIVADGLYSTAYRHLNREASDSIKLGTVRSKARRWI
jgi:hypothetical protein